MDYELVTMLNEFLIRLKGNDLVKYNKDKLVWNNHKRQIAAESFFTCIHLPCTIMEKSSTPFILGGDNFRRYFGQR